MKKNIYMGVITFITICCIITGVLKGGVLHFGSKNVHSEEKNLEAYRKLFLEGDVMDIEFKEGEKYSIHYEYTDGLDPICSVNGDTLTIKQKKKRIRFFGIGNQTCKVTIEIPQGTVLEDMNMELDVGEVTLDSIHNKATTIFLDVGEIEIDNSILGDTKLDIDTGEINILKSEFGNMEAKTDIGDIEISSIKDLTNYSFELKSGVGEVSVNDREHGRKYENDVQSDYKMKASTDIGDIDIRY
ncbi:MAG: DUF4097 domain-containing protein [Lachnospiraceae bacterium]|nr:DUF4097 domain-containing protein [Lachnospiraceae bacterium]